MKLLKILTNPRVASAIVSALSAVVCVVLAGCRLSCGEFGIKNYSAELFTTNTIPFTR